MNNVGKSNIDICTAHCLNHRGITNPLLPLYYRLCEQAQRQLQESEKFEDILLGDSRPTVVIQRYEELYSQARMEALDAIEAVQIKGSQHKDSVTTSTATMDASDMFNIQLLLEVFKVVIILCTQTHLNVMADCVKAHLQRFVYIGVCMLSHTPSLFLLHFEPLCVNYKLHNFITLAVFN